MDDGREDNLDLVHVVPRTSERTHALKLVLLLSSIMVTGALLTSSLVSDPHGRPVEDESGEVPQHVPGHDAESEIIDVSHLPRVSDELTATPVSAPSCRRSRGRDRK